MGDIKKKQKRFSRPRKLFDKTRIDEENGLVNKYGLKNKREIWKVKAEVSKVRRQAKGLIGEEEEEKKEFFERLQKIGFDVHEISDVLAMKEEDWLNRRLQTIVFKKKLANTPRQARQMIVHKHVFVDGSAVNVPSFIVSRDLESKITIKPKKEKSKIPEKSEDIKPEEDNEQRVGEESSENENKETKEENN